MAAVLHRAGSSRAVERINRYFDEHPEEVLLTRVTDSSGHCECENCRALDPGRKNVIGRDHLTDRYLTWANAVVEGVLEKHPDKWFGFLAYSEVFEPPDRVTPHPRLIPYITYDRMKWIDPQIRADGEAVTRRWSAMLPTVGWYDYIYGAAYLVPRSTSIRWPTTTASPTRTACAAWSPRPTRTLPKAQALGLAQAAVGPDAGRGRAARRVQVAAVGPGGALRQASTRTGRTSGRGASSTSDWWTPAGQSLRFNVPTYLENVTRDEIAQSRRGWRRGGGGAHRRVRTRAELLLRGFEL